MINSEIIDVIKSRLQSASDKLKNEKEPMARKAVAWALKEIEK